MTEQELRRRVCDQARAWLGLNEADGSHRAIIDLYNTIAPLPRGYRMTYGDPWCAAFVSAVGTACGLSAYILPECGCGPMIELYKAAGRWEEYDGYLPEPGDIILYDWDDSGVGDCTGAPDHVGIVTSVTGDLITITEGNISDAVGERSLWRDSRHIRGYGLPDYATAAIVLSGDDEIPEPVEIAVEEQTADGCDPVLPVLREGMVCGAVRSMQALLILRGYRCGPDGADGDFGPNTRAALRRFQRATGLPTDAELGPADWQRLICNNY